MGLREMAEEVVVHVGGEVKGVYCLIPGWSDRYGERVLGVFEDV